MPRLDRKLLGARIKDTRLRAGMTQSDLGEAVGITGESIGRVERGEYEPSLSTMIFLSEVLGATLDNLVRGTAPLRPKVGGQTAPLLERLMIRAGDLDPASLRTVVSVVEMLPAGRRKR